MRPLNILPLALVPLSLSACVIVIDGDSSSDLAASYAYDEPLLPAETAVEPFTRIEASAGTTVTLRRADAHRLVFDDEAQARITYEVDGETLRVTCRKVRFGRCARGDRGEVTAYAPSVEALTVSSGAVLTVADGFGDVAALDAHASSGGSLDASALDARTVEAHASSGGSVRVTASGDLEARASSGGSVRYGGNPRVDMSTSSGGSVNSD